MIITIEKILDFTLTLNSLHIMVNNKTIIEHYI